MVVSSSITMKIICVKFHYLPNRYTRYKMRSFRCCHYYYCPPPLPPHRLKLRRLSTYLRASIPTPSVSPRGPHPAAVPPIFALVDVCPSPHRPLLNPVPDDPLDEPAAPSCARRTRNPSRSSSTLNPVSARGSTSVSGITSADEGGSRSHTTHQPRLVLHVRSISEYVCRVSATVARICE